MDDLVKEIHDTLSIYKAQGKEVRDPVTGAPYHMLEDKNPENGERIGLTISDPNFAQPPVGFEKKTGLKNVAAHYHMPEGLKPSALQDYALCLKFAILRKDVSEDIAQDKMLQVFHALASRNPELAVLETHATEHAKTYDILMGVASDFKVKDIDYWMNGNSLFSSLQEPAYAEASHKASKFGYMNWAAAPDTLKDVDRQIQETGFVRRLAKKLNFA